jgi:hypothetical protein
MNMSDSKEIRGKTRAQQNRLLGVLGWALFGGGAIWVFVMTVFVSAATVGIPFAMMNDFQGHLGYLQPEHWLRGLKSPETIGISAGICLLFFESLPNWKWNRWWTHGIVLVSPFLFSVLVDFERAPLLLMPWWVLFFLLFGAFFAPLLTLQMFFKEVDGEFWIDGGNIILTAGWWAIFCAFTWLGLFLKRRGLIIPIDEEASS